MKKRYRFSALISALILIACLLCACTVDTVPKDERPYVVCTIFPQYDFVRKIVGDTMRVELLVPAGGETHTFAVKDIGASHLNDLLDADMILSTGGESDEHLIGELQSFLRNKNDRVAFLALTELIASPLDEYESLGMHIEEEAKDRDHGHDGEEIDEHVWTSPKRVIELVTNLTPRLETIAEKRGADPSSYEKNASAFIAELTKLDGELTEITQKKRFDTLIFADRFPFRYLCHDYGLNADAAFAGCSTEVEPAAVTLDHLYKVAHDLGLPAVLYMEGSKPVYAQKLAQDLGVPALLLHSCHMISSEEFEKYDYIALMEQNVAVLKTALGAK